MGEPENREEMLAKVPLFDGLSREALAIVASTTKEEAFPRGERIFNYGELGETLYVIVAGKVRISREVSGIGEEALAVLGEGEVFGEMALLDEIPRSADATAHESVKLLSIRKAEFDDMLYLHKDIAYEVLWSCVRMLSGRLRETNDKLTFLSTSGKF